MEALGGSSPLFLVYGAAAGYLLHGGQFNNLLLCDIFPRS